jgi:hypothetical protein
MPNHIMRFSRLTAVSLYMVTLTFAFSAPAHAQEKVNALKPVSKQTFQTYMTIASINVCELLNEKVDFKKAIKANVLAIASWVINAHGGIIESVNDSKKMPDNVIANGVANDLALGVYAQCNKLLPAADAKQIQQLIKELESGGQKGGSPTAPSK